MSGSVHSGLSDETSSETGSDVTDHSCTTSVSLRSLLGYSDDAASDGGAQYLEDLHNEGLGGHGSCVHTKESEAEAYDFEQHDLGDYDYQLYRDDTSLATADSVHGGVEDVVEDSYGLESGMSEIHSELEEVDFDWNWSSAGSEEEDGDWEDGF